jgi:hypothetical protein
MCLRYVDTGFLYYQPHPVSQQFSKLPPWQLKILLLFLNLAIYLFFLSLLSKVTYFYVSVGAVCHDHCNKLYYPFACSVQTIPLLIIKPSGSLKAKHNESICCANFRLYTRRIKKITRYMNLSRFKAQNLKVKSENWELLRFSICKVSGLLITLRINRFPGSIRLLAFRKVIDLFEPGSLPTRRCKVAKTPTAASNRTTCAT